MNTNKLSHSKYTIETEIEIKAAVDQVWKSLVQGESYEKWNSFIPWVRGDISVGSVLDIVIHVPGESKKKYKVEIKQIEHQVKLSWLGHFVFPGLIDGYHTFELENLSPASTRLIHRETFKGILVPFVWKSFLNTKLRKGFENLNHDLKIFLESSR